MTAYPDGFTLDDYARARARIARQETMLDDAVASVLDRQRARIFAGAIGLGGALATATAITLAGTMEHAPFEPAQVLVASDLAAVAAYALARIVLRLVRLPRTSIEPERLRRRLVPSLALPLAALAILAPLSLHFALYRLFDETSSTRDFTWWMMISGVIVGHAHLALVVFGVRFVRSLERAPLATKRDAVGRGVVDVLMTAGIASLPGAVLILIPPLLTLLTGLVFVPLAYLCVYVAHANEARAIEAREAWVAPPLDVEQLEAA